MDIYILFLFYFFMMNLIPSAIDLKQQKEIPFTSRVDWWNFFVLENVQRKRCAFISVRPIGGEES